jgi:hypothetical protein
VKITKMGEKNEIACYKNGSASCLGENGGWLSQTSKANKQPANGWSNVTKSGVSSILLAIAKYEKQRFKGGQATYKTRSSCQRPRHALHFACCFFAGATTRPVGAGLFNRQPGSQATSGEKGKQCFEK